MYTHLTVPDIDKLIKVLGVLAAMIVMFILGNAYGTAETKTEYEILMNKPNIIHGVDVAVPYTNGMRTGYRQGIRNALSRVDTECWLKYNKPPVPEPYQKVFEVRLIDQYAVGIIDPYSFMEEDFERTND